MTTIREITVDHWTIELDDGESLRALNVGDAVELNASTGHPGIWIAAEFIGEFREVVRLQAGAAVDCATDPAITCQYAGNRHAHPVDVAGIVQPMPVSV